MHLIEALLDLCKSSPSIIAIDGPAGAGKTTLASVLRAGLTSKKVSVVHMDDLYGGWEISEGFTARLAALVKDFKAGRPHQLEIYDWHMKRFTSQRTVSPCDILIIEGVGAGQRAIRGDLNALIWLEIDDDQGLERVLSRDGREIEEQMVRWQQLQQEHFLREETKNAADFELTT